MPQINDYGWMVILFITTLTYPLFVAILLTMLFHTKIFGKKINPMKFFTMKMN